MKAAANLNLERYSLNLKCFLPSLSLFLPVIIIISRLMGNQKWVLWESLEHCVFSLWVCPLPFKTRTLSAVCIDKTHEYLTRAIYHLTSLLHQSNIHSISHSVSVLCTQHCIFTHVYPACQQCGFSSSVWPVSSHPTLPHFSCLSSNFFWFFNPIEKWRTRCRCSVSSSARPSASLMSAWPLWSCPLMFSGNALFPLQICYLFPQTLL